MTQLSISLPRLCCTISDITTCSWKWSLYYWKWP